MGGKSGLGKGVMKLNGQYWRAAETGFMVEYRHVNATNNEIVRCL